MATWRQIHRRSLHLLEHTQAAVASAAVVVASGDRLLGFEGMDQVRELRTGFEIMGLAANAHGTLACIGEDRTLLLTREFTTLFALSGSERPDGTRYAQFALTADRFVYLRAGREPALSVLDLQTGKVVAGSKLNGDWLDSPTEFVAHSDTLFYAGCPLADESVLVRLADSRATVEALPCRGGFLGFFAGRSAYACEWEGVVSFASFPDGALLREINVERLTPITVPDVFTAVAERRGATAQNGEIMFDDVFADPSGRKVPFAIWTGALDGETVAALHEDSTLRIWQPV